jgi:hypothetical protein
MNTAIILTAIFFTGAASTNDNDAAWLLIIFSAISGIVAVGIALSHWL